MINEELQHQIVTKVATELGAPEIAVKLAIKALRDIAKSSAAVYATIPSATIFIGNEKDNVPIAIVYAQVDKPTWEKLGGKSAIIPDIPKEWNVLVCEYPDAIDTNVLGETDIVKVSCSKYVVGAAGILKDDTSKSEKIDEINSGLVLHMMKDIDEQSKYMLSETELKENRRRRVLITQIQVSIELNTEYLLQYGIHPVDETFALSSM